TIPPNIQNRENLLELQLGNNNLEGTIPSGIGNLHMLQIALNLSYNSLVGIIPNTLSSLARLQMMDFSNNRLTWEITVSLARMKSLTILDLSYNSLTGSIPSSLTGNQNLHFNATGNIDLTKNGITGKGSSHYTTLIKVIGVVGVVVVFIVLCLILEFLWIKVLQRQGFNLSQAISKILQKVEHPRISYEELVIATNTFNESNLLAITSFGSVYKGILTDCVQVAVKVLNLMSEESDKIFKAECKVLQMKLLNIAIDIAHAIEYLHYDSYVQIVHCDITPSNILLDEDMPTHLSDFGLARLMEKSSIDSLTSTMDLKGSLGYIAP
ncbi:hypothetical protein KI387_004904, partial [Taxus chinensis]